MNLTQIREKYPQYNDLSDEALAKGFHKKFYSDMPFDAFSKKIGFNPKMIPGNETPAETAPAKTPSFGEKLIGQAETALSVGSGMLGGLVGNVVGLARGMHPSVIGTREGAQEAKGRAAEVASALTYQPRTEAGQTNLQELGNFISDTKLEGLGPTVPLSGVAKVQKPRVKYADIVVPEKPAPVPTTRAKGTYTAADAAADGFTVTPRQARPDSTTASLVEGISGSAKMEKGASIKSQKNANRLVAEDFGLDASKPLTEADLQTIINTEGKAYQAVKDSGIAIKSNDSFKKTISELGGDFKAATAELEGLVDTPKIDALVKSLSVEGMSSKAAIEAVKYLRFQSTRNLKGGFADPEKAALGMAQKRAANALDDLIEVNLAEAGKKDISDAYRAARVKIAKAHTAQAALNDATGNIDMGYLAKIADKQELSGGMGKVASFAKAFGGSARNVDNMKDGAGFSLADLAVGGAGGVATGNLLGAAAVAARPALRSVALSSLGQKMVVPSISEARRMSPQAARVKLIKLSELGKAANDPNMNALITVLAERAEQGGK